MSGIMKVRGKGKLEIIFIGSGAGGGTGLNFGESCVIVRKPSVNNPETMTNILVNYGMPSNNFPIHVRPCNAPTLVLNTDDINAILPTSLVPNHIDKIANFVKSRSTYPVPIDLIVPSDPFANNFWIAIKNEFPTAPDINTIFNLQIYNPNGTYDDIGIDYDQNGVYIDERILYSSNAVDLIEFCTS